MSTDDLHSPTSAGPEPTPAVAPAAGTWEQPAGTAVHASTETGERPELLAGAAFAGGLVAAFVLKHLRGHD